MCYCGCGDGDLYHFGENNISHKFANYYGTDTSRELETVTIVHVPPWKYLKTILPH